MAALGYARQTADIDFAVAMPPPEFAELHGKLRNAGFDATLSPSDGNDPLGGVITIERAGSLTVQLVNFDNTPGAGFPALVRDALERAQGRTEGVLGVVPRVEDLILFKLYAGGPKSKLDILELLSRVPANLDVLRERARGYQLVAELAAVLRALGE